MLPVPAIRLPSWGGSIETEEQVHALISCGVEEGQGYLVAAPLPFRKFAELLDRASPDPSAGVTENVELVAVPDSRLKKDSH